ncbi:tetratricopeptide repeat protein [Nevskia sp.]|uniref:tetratricopeptide repeat protein n=1 Tax=Nevskia sp. TaxID=1929292 RepID=UPI0025DA6C7D|nr:tetratricopeptide repeat protein [Nevskia sp.]
MRAPLLVGLALFGLAACQSQPTRPLSAENYEVEAADPAKVRQIKNDAVRTLLDQGQYYAALAHIEEQKQGQPDSPDLIYLEAEARRHLRQLQQSEALYQRLMGGPLEGKAWHGLGLLTARSDLEAAIRSLRNASAKLPTDVEIRNDLGYALMEAGRYTEALPELSTAAELAPSQLKSRNNLIILMLLTGNQAGAEQMAKQSGATPETVKQLRSQAQSIRSQQASRGARSPT